MFNVYMSVDLKNTWNSTSIHPYAVMTERGKFYLFFHGPNACIVSVYILF